jgi:aconitate decarboxylase
VQIKLNNGRMIDSGDIRFARGNAKLPLTGEELKRKFLDCLSSARDVDAESIYSRLARLDSVANVQELTTAHR